MDGPGGEPLYVTADDFAFAAELASALPGRSHALQWLGEFGPTIEVLGDFEFRVLWPVSSRFNLEGTLSLYPAPRQVFGVGPSGERLSAADALARADDWPSHGFVGTGPFRFESATRSGILLTRFDDHWGDDGHLSAIRYVPRDSLTPPVAASDLTVIRPEEGEGGEEADVPEWLDGRSVEVSTGSVRYIGWNATRQPFQDARLRRAMTLAFDRERVIEEICGGLASQATSTALPGSGAYDPDIRPEPFDLAAAAALLDAAGWSDRDGDGVRDDAKGRPLRFELLFPQYRDEEVEAVEMFQQDLDRIGVAMTPVGLGWRQLQERFTTGDFDAYSGAWLLGMDEYQLWHSSGPLNFVGYANPAVDALVERAAGEIKPSARNTLLRELHALVYGDHPFTFVRVPYTLVVWSNELRDVEIPVDMPMISLRRAWWNGVPAEYASR